MKCGQNGRKDKRMMKDINEKKLRIHIMAFFLGKYIIKGVPHEVRELADVIIECLERYDEDE